VSDCIRDRMGVEADNSHRKTLVYIVYLLAFRSLFRTLDSMEKIQQRMKGVPQIVIEGMLSRFAEATRGSSTSVNLVFLAIVVIDYERRAQKTSTTETKLMTYLFALCLHLDDFAVDTSVLAKDLSMTVAKCVHFLFLLSSPPC
jgi:DNA-directed RNA polymerase I subunit RPA49